MADPIAGPAGNAIQVAPPDAEFKAPFTASSKSAHTMTNTSASKVCIKLKVFDQQLLQCTPTVAFMTPGQQMPLNFVHKTFAHNPSENYEKRKLRIFYADVPETATDANAFAKECPAAKWKVVKMQVKYLAGDAAAPAAPAAPAPAAAEVPPT